MTEYFFDDAENFNSHAHVERDFVGLADEVYKWNFNSHAHVERDEFDNDNNASYLNFNSHAHVERDS